MGEVKRAWLVYGLAFIGGFVVFLITISFVFSLVLGLREKDLGKPRIGVLEIKGVITDSEEYINALKSFVRDEKVKAIVVRIDSPGGTVGASQEIFEELKKARKIKPVVISIGNIATSGGLYVALGGNKIFASPGSITGSVGVILQIPNLEKFLKKIGIEAEVIKSGEFKDTGSFYRSITPREREYLQEKVNMIHRQFVKAIAEERKLSETHLREIANGKIFTGEEALQLGLIDRLGTFWDAVEEAKSLAKIREAKLIYQPRKKSIFWRLLEEENLTWFESLFYRPWFLVFPS